MRGESNIAEKEYLTIGEVAEKFGISVAVLRKWEKDFPKILKPMRTSGESRLYNRKQQEKVAMIVRLRDEGYSIEGTKKKLANKQNDEEIRQEVISRLTDVRGKLMDIVDEIESLEKNSNRFRNGVIWFND